MGWTRETSVFFLFVLHPLMERKCIITSQFRTVRPIGYRHKGFNTVRAQLSLKGKQVINITLHCSDIVTWPALDSRLSYRYLTVLKGRKDLYKFILSFWRYEEKSDVFDGTISLLMRCPSYSWLTSKLIELVRQ